MVGIKVLQILSAGNWFNHRLPDSTIFVHPVQEEILWTRAWTRGPPIAWTCMYIYIHTLLSSDNQSDIDGLCWILFPAKQSLKIFDNDWLATVPGQYGDVTSVRLLGTSFLSMWF